MSKGLRRNDLENLLRNSALNLNLFTIKSTGPLALCFEISRSILETTFTSIQSEMVRLGIDRN